MRTVRTVFLHWLELRFDGIHEFEDQVKTHLLFAVDAINEDRILDQIFKIFNDDVNCIDDFLASRLNEVGLRQGFNAPSVQVHRSVQQISLACLLEAGELLMRLQVQCEYQFHQDLL